MPLDVVPDELERGFVCTWCGESFARREQLEAHWTLSEACGRNRAAVSSMRPDARVFGSTTQRPGDETLRRVEAQDRARELLGQPDDDPRRA